MPVWCESGREDEEDRLIRRKMLGYCDEIEEAHNSFGRSFDECCSNSVYRNAVCLCIMQIGELSNHLSEKFKEDHPAIPWNQIRGMRNVVAHEYGSLDVGIIWETAVEDSLVIKSFCNDILGK